MQPILLDLFSGAGGAAYGYSQAGFKVIGVDLYPQKRFPFEFIQADWAEPLTVLPGLWEREGRPYAIHASPPCQHYSAMTKRWGRAEDHPDLIGEVRERLEEIGCPYVLENVPGAPLRHPLLLCGSMFGLGSGEYQLRKHRLFETNFPVVPPPSACNHFGLTLAVYGHTGGRSRRDGLTFPKIAQWRKGMGIDWMTEKELSQAIPPAYTYFLGKQLLTYLQGEAR